MGYTKISISVSHIYLFLPRCSLTSAYVVIEVLQPISLKKMTQDSLTLYYIAHNREISVSKES